jgi:hypothetical protein
MIDTVFRYRSAMMQAAPMLTSKAATDPVCEARRIGELLEKAADDDVMTGVEWDELTRLTSAAPGLLPVPTDLWVAVTRRLLDEIIMADGVFWMQRFEALNRILAHPTLGDPGLRTIQSVIDDRSVQSLVGTACLYDASAHPEATVDVLRYLEDPHDERVFKGTLMACVRKLRYGHFFAPQMERLSPIVSAFIADASAPAETRSLAVSVLRRIPAHLHSRSSRSLIPKLRNDGYLTVYQTDSLVARTISSAVARRISRVATARLAEHFESREDAVLAVLVEEMLFDPVFDARLYAAFLIYLSPYRPFVASALMDEVLANRYTTDVAWLTTLFEALRVLGDQSERSIVERFVMAPGVADAINDAASYALGHIGGTSSDTFWTTAVQTYATACSRSLNQRSESILDRIVYAIGISGNRPLLIRVRDATNVPAVIRTSAQWWLSQPPVLRRSAQS